MPRFFTDCKIKKGSDNMPYYPFGTLYHLDRWPVFSVNDPGHCQKDVIRALRFGSQ